MIESLGRTGLVKEIQIFSTILNTPKGETIILPNGAVSNATLVNYTHLGSALIEIPADLAGKTNIEDLRKLILPVIAQDERIFTDPEPSIGIVALKAGTLSVAFRAFTLPQNQPPVTGRMIETIKTELEKNNIEGPIAHSFVHTIAETNK